MARDAVPQAHELPQERFLDRAEQRHVRAILAAGQYGAGWHQQQFMQVMAGIILPRVNDLGKAGDEFFHGRASTLNPRLESSHASPSNPRLQPPAPYAIALIQCWSSSFLPPHAGIPGRRGGAPRGEGALANLVSGGTVSTPRSLIRVGGAPRRAAALYISGAVRQPTFRPGRRSLGPTGPVPPSGSGPIRLSVFAGAPPARIPPTVPLQAPLRQAGFSSIPCGTAPSWRYRQSAIRSFRARATIMTLRRRPRELPRRSWNQRESAQPGWERSHLQASS